MYENLILKTLIREIGDRMVRGTGETRWVRVYMGVRWDWWVKGNMEVRGDNWVRGLGRSGEGWGGQVGRGRQGVRIPYRQVPSRQKFRSFREAFKKYLQKTYGIFHMFADPTPPKIWKIGNFFSVFKMIFRQF